MKYKRHWSYLKYVVRHKWFVFIASFRITVIPPLWRMIVHDMSKFRPSEWFPYAETFYAPDGSKQYKPTEDFDIAWLHHQHRNPHHWQYWMLKQDNGKTKVIDMPREYIIEMVADWMGAGKAITGEWEVKEWYGNNKHKIVMSDKTKELVEWIINGL